MPETHGLVADIERLNAIEKQIIERFIHRQRAARELSQPQMPLGDRVADRVAAFGGSWGFIFTSVAVITLWLWINSILTKAFDPYPFILLNLVLSCLAALQAPIIMMSQNRQAAHDRLDAQHDYEVNAKAELEIVGLHAKLDELREQKWVELMKAQEAQLALLTQLASQGEGRGTA